jgi:hypothetical protein
MTKALSQDRLRMQETLAGASVSQSTGCWPIETLA